MNSNYRGLGISVLVLVVILAFAFVVSLPGALYTPRSGEVTVIRNGKSLWPADWFDNKKISKVVPNGSGQTNIGFGSEAHPYPVYDQQRYFKIGGADSDADAMTVPTSDGVETTIRGTFYFKTVFGNPDLDPNNDLLKRFDTQFATRDWNGKKVYEGTIGFSHWLGAVVEPIVANDLRQSISGVRCSELLASCALVQNSGQSTQTVDTKALADSKTNQQNLIRIQKEVADNLRSDLKETLGADYFSNIQFQVAGASPPAAVQQAIEDAQSAFAAISQAQAKVQSAKADAEANRERQRGYVDCPACAKIDELKAIPGSVTTYAPGGSYAVTSH